MRNYNKKRKSPTKILLTISIISVGLFLASKDFLVKNNPLKEDVIVAQFGDETMYRSDIERKINALFEVSTISNPYVQFESLTDDIVQILSREIFLDRKLNKKAEEARISNDRKVIHRIESYRTAIIRQLYIDSKISIDEKEIRGVYEQKYIGQNQKTEYRTSQIITESKAKAEKVKKMLKGNNFNELYKKFSIRKNGPDKSADIGYLSEDSFLPEIKSVLSRMKIGETSKPIATGKEWTIIKLIDKIEPKIPSYEEVKSDIESDLKKSKYEEMAKMLTKDAEFKIIVSPKKNDVINNSSDQFLDQKKINDEKLSSPELDSVNDEKSISGPASDKNEI